MKKIFKEMHVIAIDQNQEISNESLVKAVTLNENLKSLGLVLKPMDIIKVAKSSEINTLYDRLRKYVGEVLAKPMYPNFPTEVMLIDEAEYRLHQLMHYFSTYGLMSLGFEVDKGWLPDRETIEKTKKDDALLDLHVVEIVDDIYSYAAEKILSRRQRMTLPEKEIIRQCIKHLDADFFDFKIPFKQNLLDLVQLFADQRNQAAARKVCQHTGDVLKCLDYYLTRNKWKLTTSQKKFWVKLLESYDVKDFESNIMLSIKKGERSELVLRYLDFNNYSRSKGHRKALAKLRNKDLKSWEAKWKAVFAEGNNRKGLEIIAQRPGIMLRNLTFLLRNGCSKKDITEALDGTALSAVTIVSLLNTFGKRDSEEADMVYDICLKALSEYLASVETPILGKKVFIDEGIYDIDHSEIRGNARSEEGGYVPSGIAYRIPECRHLRAFVYWNSEQYSDVDLHGAGEMINGDDFHIGWNASFRNAGVVMSGDITHPDAAEYIDIDVDYVKNATINIDVFSGGTFKDLETCFAGLMAVNRLGQDVKLYDPANCFFSHDLNQNSRFIHYAYIDVENRFLLFDGTAEKNKIYDSEVAYVKGKFDLRQYLEIFFTAQGAELVEKDDAEVILSMEKAENSISLFDENFFLD
jgi:hypothetical protein